MLIEPYREVTKSSGHRKFELSENLKQITGNKEIIISKWMGRECNKQQGLLIYTAEFEL